MKKSKLSQRKIGLGIVAAIFVALACCLFALKQREQKLERLRALNVSVGVQLSDRQNSALKWISARFDKTGGTSGGAFSEKIRRKMELFAKSYTFSDSTGIDYQKLAPELHGWPANRAKSFSVFFNPMSDADFLAFPELPRLKNLSFSGRPVTDAGILTLIDRFPALEELKLTSSKITDESVKALVAAFPDLKKLQIRHSTVTDAALSEVIKLSNLQDFSIGSRTFDGRNLNQLSALPALRALELINIRDGNLSSVAGATFPTAASLQLDLVDLSAANMAAIAKAFPNLQRLSIRQTTAESPEILGPLKALPVLERLDFYLKKGFDDSYENALGELAIKTVYINKSALSGPVLKRINAIRNAKGLREL